MRISSDPPTDTAASPSASVDESTALRQWGSLVAGIESPVRAAGRKIANCTSFDYGPGAVACTFGPLTFDFAVQSFSIKFNGGIKRLGAAPAELASLVAATKTDAHAVHVTERRVTAGCDRTESAACEQVLTVFYQSVSALMGDLDAWRPYTG